MVTFPPFRLDAHEGRLWKREKLLVLRRKPFAILCYLAAHPKKLVTHEELLEQVWRGAVVSDSAVRSHLHELRQVLGEGVIETVIGRGYRFVAELGDCVDAPAAGIPRPDPLVVGRDAELEMLGEAFAQPRGARRQLCFVSGEPGIGKSTLVRTFLAGLDARTVTIAVGRASSSRARRSHTLRSSRRSLRLRDLRAVRRRSRRSFATRRRSWRRCRSSFRMSSSPRLRGARLEQMNRDSSASSARRSKRSLRRIRSCWRSKTCNGPTLRRSICCRCSPSARSARSCWCSAPCGVRRSRVLTTRSTASCALWWPAPARAPSRCRRSPPRRCRASSTGGFPAMRFRSS